jgi:hypothetical protein
MGAELGDSQMLRFAIALGTSLALATTANAACTAGNLAGKWQAYSVGAQNGHSSYWVRCTVTINAAGNLSGSCADMSGSTGHAAGKLTMAVPATCTFKGQFTLFGLANNVVHGTLSKDGTTGSAVGTFSGGNFALTFIKL